MIVFNLESVIEPANSSLAIPLSFIVTAPLETLKLSELNEAIPLLDAVASSPDITPLFISIPSPAVYSVLVEEIVLFTSIDIPLPAVYSVLVSVEDIVTAPAFSVIVTFDPAVNASVSPSAKVLPPAVTDRTVSVSVEDITPLVISILVPAVNAD